MNMNANILLFRLSLLGVVVFSCSSLLAQSHINNHLGINGIHFVPFSPFSNLAGTNVSPDPFAANPSAIPTSDYVNNNAVVLTETNIDIPAPCVSDPSVCASGGGGLFESNGHQFFFSADDGTSPYDFQEENAFDISFDMQVVTTDPLNRKGLGFQIDSDPGGSNNVTQFTGQTTNNLFGGAAPGQIGVSSSTIIPNYSFSNNDTLFYTAGDTTRLQIIYLPPERDGGGLLVTRGTLEYIVDTTPGVAGGDFSSGAQEILTQTVNSKSIDGGILDGTHFGFRMQIVADHSSDDSYTATYSNFEILDPAADADFDDDTDIDGADFLVWQRGFATPAGTATPDVGDANGDMNVDSADLAIWKSQYGNSSPISGVGAFSTVPEPSTLVLGLGSLMLFSGLRKSRRSKLV